MKLRLLQSGYETMTGYLGIILFQDGVSVDDVNAREARQLALAIRVEYEDGSDPNPAQHLLDHMHTEAALANELSVVVETPVESVSPDTLTLEDLELIADKSGIPGLREIAETYGVQGTSILELIDAILKVQKPVEQIADSSQVEDAVTETVNADPVDTEPAFLDDVIVDADVTIDAPEEVEAEVIIEAAVEPVAEAPVVVLKASAKPKVKKESK